MKLSNINCELIKIDSTIIKGIIAGDDYDNLSVKLKSDCCSSSTSVINIDVQPYSNGSCPSCDNEQYVYGIQFTPGPNSIDGIYLLDTNTNEYHNFITSSIDFDYLLNSCSNYNCNIDSLGTHYEDIIKTQLEDWFDLYGITHSNLSVSFCGNMLLICGLPQQYALLKATSGTKEIFSTFKDYSGWFLANGFLFIRSNFLDGIYSINITKIANNQYTVESGNLFIDCNIGCLLSKTMANLNSTDIIKLQEAYNIFLIYFGLTNTTNCSSSDELCSLYKTLSDYLSNVPNYLNSNLNLSGCGCS